MKIYNNIIATIGNTPLVRINNLTGKNDARVLAKLEKFNPGGSVKDRIAKYMIEEAEKQGLLTKNKKVLEATSGNTGIGLALTASVKGYKVLFTMPESVSVERRKILEALGSEILLTPKEKGTDGAIDKAHELFKENPEKYYMPNQFDNICNVTAHYQTTGKEIIDDLEGNIDMFVSAIGTSGTVMGVGRRLKEFNENIKVVGVEPNNGHKIQGLKNMKEAYVPGIYDETKLDEKIIIKDEDAYETAKKLALEEGLFVGMSSGAAMFVALQKAKELGKGKTIVVLLPDGGEKYLSTNLFD